MVDFREVGSKDDRWIKPNGSSTLENFRISGVRSSKNLSYNNIIAAFVITFVYCELGN